MYVSIVAKLVEHGYVFERQMDTVAVAHLIHFLYEGDILAAVQAACQRLQGAYALAVLCDQEPGRLIGAREGSPWGLPFAGRGIFLALIALPLAGQAGTGRTPPDLQ